MYAVQGLRTLCIAKRVSGGSAPARPAPSACGPAPRHVVGGGAPGRALNALRLLASPVCPAQVLSQEEYAGWLQRHLEAESSVDNREELLFQSAIRLETNLHLLGN